MNKLYILYISKNYDEKPRIADVINDYLHLNRHDPLEVVISPGYLGGGNEFIEKVCRLYGSNISRLVIYKGITQSDRYCNTINELKTRMNPRGIDVVDKFGGVDHRKMVFFNHNGDDVRVKRSLLP